MSTPLLHGDRALGAITIRRREVRPFSNEQIAQLETYAALAAVAIDRARMTDELKDALADRTRLFNELEERNAALRQALEHQTATAEVLSIISRSPTDVQPVLDAICESAARVCGIDDVTLRMEQGTYWVSAAHWAGILTF